MDVLFEAQLHELVGVLDAVGVEVVERSFALVVHGENGEGGAAHLGGGNAEFLSYPFHEVRFSRAEVSVEGEDGAGAEPLRDPSAQVHRPFDRRRGAGEEVPECVDLRFGHGGRGA